jgi:hypothetical protein
MQLVEITEIFLLLLGVLESWKVGKLESWKVGKLEGWKVGRLEGWKVGREKIESKK